jgi:alkaline phosphatase
MLNGISDSLAFNINIRMNHNSGAMKIEKQSKSKKTLEQKGDQYWRNKNILRRPFRGELKTNKPFEDENGPKYYSNGKITLEKLSQKQPKKSIIFNGEGKLKQGGLLDLEDEQYWKKKGMSELKSVLNSLNHLKTNRAKNVILFIGDGMSLPTITASRIYKAQQITKNKNAEGSLLTFEKFPHLALSKTYSLDRQTPDSASTASAIFTGVKTKFLTMGFDASIEFNSKAAQESANKVDSIMKWAQDARKDTGFVTNTRVTHATPAALYAHVANRVWECDRKTPSITDGDITLQLLRSDPGRKAKVILGGGRESWCPGSLSGAITRKCNKHEEKPASDWNCTRLDGIDLIDEFLEKHKTIEQFKNMRGEYVSNRAELLDVDVENVDYLLGLFSDSYMKYESEKEHDSDPEKEPSLAEMTKTAIKVLKKNNNGFFLMVEGGKIDKAHHASKANQAMHETVALDEAVEEALGLVDVEETLVIVTADHGHTMSISGYPSRGADIRGIVDDHNAEDNKPYMILSYANGEGFAHHLTHDHGNVTRRDLRKWGNYTDFNFVNPSSVPGMLWSSLVPGAEDSVDETHSGADVGIFATGPYAHLFQSVHEQSYIAHVIAYSACIGPFGKSPRDKPSHCRESK